MPKVKEEKVKKLDSMTSIEVINGEEYIVTRDEKGEVISKSII